jgi:hypothetical protein
VNSWLTAHVELLLEQTSKSRWQGLTDEAKAPMQQRWGYGDALAGLGAQVLRMEIRSQGRTIALVQGLRRRFVLPVTLITRGPVWLGEPGTAERAAVLRRLRAGLMGPLLCNLPEAEDCEAAAEAGLAHLMTPGSVALLRTGPGLRDGMHGKWRNRLRAAERANLTVRIAPPVPTSMEWLFRVDSAQQKSQRYRALPAVFTRAWHRVDPEGVVMLTAELDDEMVAAMLFLKHGTSATYHIGWTGPAGRAVSAGNLLLARAAERLCEMGVESVDLGLLDTETAPGLARFKLGMGAQPLTMGGTWIGW